jgi:hypothetical protein
MPRDSSDDIKGKDPNCSFKSRHTSHVSSVLDFVIETAHRRVLDRKGVKAWITRRAEWRCLFCLDAA